MNYNHIADDFLRKMVTSHCANRLHLAAAKQRSKGHLNKLAIDLTIQHSYTRYLPPKKVLDGIVTPTQKSVISSFTNEW